MISMMRLFWLSLAATVGMKAVVGDQEIGLCCLCEKCHIPPSGLGNQILYETTTCLDLVLEMADPTNDSTAGNAVCLHLQSLYRQPCCGVSSIAPHPTPAPTFKTTPAPTMKTTPSPTAMKQPTAAPPKVTPDVASQTPSDLPSSMPSDAITWAPFTAPPVTSTSSSTLPPTVSPPTFEIQPNPETNTTNAEGVSKDLSKISTVGETSPGSGNRSRSGGRLRGGLLLY